MKTKLKIAAIFICVCISALACAFAFSACNADDDSKKSEPAPIAGLFELKDIPLYYENLFITKYDYQFYKNGTVKTTIYASTTSGGYSDIRTNYGTYTWNEGDDLIYVLWSGSSKIIDLKYTGEYITNGIMYNYFAGANDSGEVAGKLALASYSVHTYAKYYLSNPGGEIVGQKEQYIKKGESASMVKAVAAEGFEFTGWSDGKTEAERRDLNVTDNVIVSANFKQVDEIYKINYEASYGGSIEGNDYQEVAEGKNATTVKAVSLADSYKFVKWSDGVTTAERTDLNVTENMEVTAEFGWVQRFTYKAEEHGSIQGEIVQYIPTGASGTAVTAVPDEGYKFSNWSDGLTAATRCEKDTTVTAETEFIAFFVPDTSYTPDPPDVPDMQTFSLVYSAGEGGRIIGTLNQKVDKGQDGSSVIAVADEGYEFIGWSDGVKNAERQDKNAMENLNVTAKFNVVIKPAKFESGDGTEENPYLISTVNQLANVVNYSAANFKLQNDIVLKTVASGQFNFKPLFSDDNPFNGTFDGNGHKIVNLTLYNTATFYTGMFACVGESGLIKNLTLENVDISGTNYIGGIAGYSQGKIINCSVSGKISYIADNSFKVFVGGVVGRIENALNECNSSVAITCLQINGEANIGGIAGYFERSGCVIADTAFTGDIDISTEERVTLEVGGLFGYTESNFNLTNVYTTGAITANGVEYVYVGGLVGVGSPTVNASYTTGAITVTGGYYVYVGGLVGDGSPTVNGSYTTGAITATGRIDLCCGGLVGESGSFMTVNGSYTTGAITATGGDEVCIGGLIGRPYLCRISSSFTVSKINITCEGRVYSGAVVGYTKSFILSAVHWLYTEGGAEYAVGYGDSLGIPSSMGSTKHNDISDFYNLAEVLNEGLEEPIWKNTADGLPVLILKNDEI